VVNEEAGTQRKENEVKEKRKCMCRNPCSPINAYEPMKGELSCNGTNLRGRVEQKTQRWRNGVCAKRTRCEEDGDNERGAEVA